MNAISARRAVNSTAWISCGIIIIAVRTLLSPNNTTLLWEIIGGGMIVYGLARLFWAFALPRRSEPV
jgi:hypothetical protein